MPNARPFGSAVVGRFAVVDWYRVLHGSLFALSDQSSFGAAGKSSGIFVVECR